MKHFFPGHKMLNKEQIMSAIIASAKWNASITSDISVSPYNGESPPFARP